jgi:hypothetical protein
MIRHFRAKFRIDRPKPPEKGGLLRNLPEVYFIVPQKFLIFSAIERWILRWRTHGEDFFAIASVDPVKFSARGLGS